MKILLHKLLANTYTPELKTQLWMKPNSHCKLLNINLQKLSISQLDA